MISFFPSAQEPYQRFVPDTSGATNSSKQWRRRAERWVAARLRSSLMEHSKLCACTSALSAYIMASVVQSSKPQKRRRSCHRPKRLTDIDLHEGRRDGRCMPLQVTAQDRLPLKPLLAGRAGSGVPQNTDDGGAHLHARQAPQHDLVGGRQAAELQPAAAGQASPQEKRLALGLCLPSKCTTPRCSTQARTAHRLLCRSSRAHTVSARTAQARSAQQPTVAPFDGAQSQGATGGAVPRRPPTVPSNASIKQLTTKHPRTAVAVHRARRSKLRMFEMAAPACGAPGAPAGTGCASAASLYIPMPCRQRQRPYISVAMAQGCWNVLYVAQPPSKLCDCVTTSR